MNLKQWYYPLQIPTYFESRKIEPFVRSMAGMWHHTLSDVAAPMISFVNSNDCPTAAADLKQNKMIINRDIWSSDKHKRPNELANPEQAIGTVIGLQLHETLHFRYSEMNLDERIKEIGLPLNQRLASIINVVEDTYIDDKAPTIGRGFDWSYLYLAPYFFTKDFVNEAFAELPTKISSFEDGDKFLRLLPLIRFMHLKFDGRFVDINFSHFPSTKETKKLSEMVMCATNTHILSDRTHLSVEIFKFLFPDEDLSKSESETKNDDNGGDDESDKHESGKSDVESEKLSKAKKLAKSFSDDLLKSDIKLASEEVVLKNEEIDIKNDVGLGADEKYVELVFKPTHEFFAQYDADKSCVLDLFKRDGGDLKKLKSRYSNLSNLMKAKAETHRHFGPQRNHGTRLRHLERIATDSKIFAEPIVLKGLGYQEIVILVDLSGSMSDKIINAFYATYAAASSLHEGGHSVAVVGHTADVSTRPLGQRVGLFMPIFKKMNESIESMEKNIRVYMEYAEMSGNNDDLAISRAKDFFTSKDNKKTLIVISDGKPASYRLDYGYEGIKLTKNAVKNLRNARINVVSISIERSAFEDNNKIYGEDKNTCNEDTSILVDLVKMIVT